MSIDDLEIPPADLFFTVEPSELDKLLYLQVAPLNAKEKRTAAVAFRLRVTNNTKVDVVVSQFTVSFPESALPPIPFDRDVNNEVIKGSHRDIYMADEETIALTLPAPKSIRIDVRFKGTDRVLTEILTLVPHKNPTPENSYAYPFKPENMLRDEYISFSHHGGGNGQHFAYDIGACGWNEDLNQFATFKGPEPTTDENGSSTATNESNFAWHKKVHAMADGVVLLRESGYPNNPRPLKNNIMRFDDATGGGITAVAIEHLDKLTISDVSNVRMLTAVRTTSGMLKLIVFEQTEDAKSVTRLGEALGDAIPDAAKSDLSLTVLDKKHAISAVTTDGVLTLALWLISDDAMTLTMLDKLLVPDVTAAKVARLSWTRIVTAARTKNGTLMLSVWKIAGDLFLPTPMGQIADAGPGQVSLIDLAVLSATRVVTMVKSGEFMKAIVWDMKLSNDKKATSITRKGDKPNNVAVTAFAVSRTDVANQVAASARLADGKLAVYYWNIDKSGVIKEIAQTKTSDAVSQVTMRLFKKESLLSAVTLATGELHLILWQLKGSEKDGFSIRRAADTVKNAAGIAGVVALASVLTPHTTAATAVRDAGGNLKVILWQLARSNRYVILHGDANHGYESVLYAHMDDMSKLSQPLLNPGDTVKKGQLLGLLGNSGASGNPHLHIHALKIPAGPAGLSKAEIQQLIDDTRDGFLDVAYRPIMFNNANAMKAKDIKNLKRGGIWENPFSVMDDEGVYFNNYVMFPGPATELPECDQLRKKIASLKAEIADLQKDLHSAGTGSQKEAIIKEVERLKEEVAELQAKLDKLPCKI